MTVYEWLIFRSDFVGLGVVVQTCEVLRLMWILFLHLVRLLFRLFTYGVVFVLLIEDEKERDVSKLAQLRGIPV